MGAYESELKAKVSAETAGFMRSMAAVDSRLASSAKAATRHGTIMGAAWRNSSATIAKGVLGTVAILGTMAGFAARTGIGFAAMKEQARTSFAVMLGSGKKATKLIADLNVLAAKTPFAFDQLTRASQGLLAMHWPAKTLIKDLTTIGDAAAAGGRGAEGVDMIIRALGQMNIKANASAEEMLQLTEAGVDAWGYLAKGILGSGTTEAISKVQEMVTKGQIDGAKAAHAVVAGMASDKRIAGMMEKQSHTLTGIWSTAKDTLSQTLSTMFEPMLPGIKKVLTDVTGYLSGGDLQKKVTSVGDWMGKTFTSAYPAAKELGGAILDLGKSALPTLVSAFSAVASVGGTVGGVLKSVSDTVGFAPMAAGVAGFIGMHDAMLKVSAAASSGTPLLQAFKSSAGLGGISVVAGIAAAGIAYYVSGLESMAEKSRAATDATQTLEDAMLGSAISARGVERADHAAKRAARRAAQAETDAEVADVAVASAKKKNISGKELNALYADRKAKREAALQAKDDADSALDASLAARERYNASVQKSDGELVKSADKVATLMAAAAKKAAEKPPVVTGGQGLGIGDNLGTVAPYVATTTEKLKSFATALREASTASSGMSATNRTMFQGLAEWAMTLDHMPTKKELTVEIGLLGASLTEKQIADLAAKLSGLDGDTAHPKVAPPPTGPAKKSINQVHSLMKTLGDYHVTPSVTVKTNTGAVDSLWSRLTTLSATNWGVHVSTTTVPVRAAGGVTNGPEMTLIGEAGREYVIPTTGANRQRGYALWLQAGRDLGVGMAAKGKHPTHPHKRMSTDDMENNVQNYQAKMERDWRVWMADGGLSQKENDSALAQKRHYSGLLKGLYGRYNYSAHHGKKDARAGFKSSARQTFRDWQSAQLDVTLWKTDQAGNLLAPGDPLDDAALKSIDEQLSISDAGLGGSKSGLLASKLARLTALYGGAKTQTAKAAIAQEITSTKSAIEGLKTDAGAATPEAAYNSGLVGDTVAGASGGGSGGSGSGTSTTYVTVNVTNSYVTVDDLASMIRESLARYGKTNGSIFGNVQADVVPR